MCQASDLQIPILKHVLLHAHHFASFTPHCKDGLSNVTSLCLNHNNDAVVSKIGIGTIGNEKVWKVWNIHWQMSRSSIFSICTKKQKFNQPRLIRFSFFFFFILPKFMNFNFIFTKNFESFEKVCRIKSSCTNDLFVFFFNYIKKRIFLTTSTSLHWLSFDFNAPCFASITRAVTNSTFSSLRHEYQSLASKVLLQPSAVLGSIWAI